MHGGRSLVGIAAPTFKHGRYSKDLPARLAGRYREAQADPDLLALRDEIALVDARLGELLGQLDSGESGQRWRRVQAAYAALQDELDIGGEILEATAVLGEAIAGGAQDGVVWGEITGLLEMRRRLVESERKRLIELQQVITAEKAMVLLAAITNVIREHVSDRGTLAAIAADIRQLTAVKPSR